MTHSTVEMVREAGKTMASFLDLLDDARELDLHYIPSRYPNGIPSGYPHQFYGKNNADQVGVPIDCSETPVTTSAADVVPPEKAFDICIKRLMLFVCAWQASSDLNSFSCKRDTTAATLGVTRCPEGVETEKEAPANNCWPEPAYSQGPPIPLLLGNLGLTADEEAAIDAYMKTFTDEHTARAPKPYK